MALVPILRVVDILKKDGENLSKKKYNPFISRHIDKMHASATLLFGDKMENEMKKLKDNKLQMTARKPF